MQHAPGLRASELHPEQEDQFFCLVREKLGSMLSGLPPALQVDVVWALCVLQQVQEAELRAVLCPELHTQFLGAGPQTSEHLSEAAAHQRYCPAGVSRVHGPLLRPLLWSPGSQP